MPRRSCSCSRLVIPFPENLPERSSRARSAAKHPAVITLIEYDREHLEERTITNKEELLPHLDNQRITWINIDGLGDIDVLRTLGTQFNLHPLALEDVLATGQRPKMEQYDELPLHRRADALPE